METTERSRTSPATENSPPTIFRDTAMTRACDVLARLAERGPSRIRTGDGGFAIRCHLDASAELADTSDDAGKPLALQLAQDSEKTPSVDHDLTRVVDAWPSLPGNLKAAILAMIGAGNTPRGDGA